MNQVMHMECGKTAFFYDGVPPSWAPQLIPAKTMLVTGARPKFGEPVRCGSCGKKVRVDEMEWVIR